MPNLVPFGPQAATCIRFEGCTHTRTHTRTHAHIYVECLFSLYSEVRDIDANTSQLDSGCMDHAVALAGLVTYIEEAHIYGRSRDTNVCDGRPGSSIDHHDLTAWNNRDQTCSLDQTEEPDCRYCPDL